MRRPCIRCGCLLERGSYCRPCNPRGTSWRQERFRRETLRITGGCCARCGSPLEVQAHHPHPVCEGGGGATVGEPLCKPCHRQAHS